MMVFNNRHYIIIKHGFIFGADFNISCREWNMLMSKKWLIENVMNRALAILQNGNVDNGKKYWIFNTYKMEYLMGLKLGYNVNATNYYKRIPGWDII